MTDSLIIPLTDNPHAPDVFASGFSGLSAIGGNVCITLENLKFDHSVEPSGKARIVIGRLIIPLIAAQGLVAELNTFLENNGVGVSQAIQGDHTKQ